MQNMYYIFSSNVSYNYILLEIPYLFYIIYSFQAVTFPT